MSSSHDSSEKSENNLNKEWKDLATEGCILNEIKGFLEWKT